MRTRGDDPMRGGGRWMAVVVIVATLGLAGCSEAAAGGGASEEKVIPATVEAIPNQDVKKVTITEQAAQRTGVETAAIAIAPASLLPAGTRPSPSMTVVPYSAIVYDPSGVTWVYTVPEPLTYVRAKVVVATVGGAKGTEAVLSGGLPAGTTVVTKGVIELYGAELGVGK
jgi:hypothetical protein